MDSFAGRRHAHALQSVPRKMEKEEGPKAFLCISACALLSLDSQDLAAIVGTASLASSVGHDGLTALGQTATLGADSFQLEPRRLSRRALDTLHLGTAMVTPPWSNCF